jgi:hypothetical protein
LATLAALIVTVAEVVRAPSLSVATAVSEYVPVATEDHVAVYGAAVSEPISVVPEKKSTRAMVPSLSLAAAANGTFPPAVTIDPLAGDVNATIGG